MSAYIFACYSRRDERLVTHVVRLLRAAIAGVPSIDGRHGEFVFQDVDNIPPGSNWTEHVDAAIAKSERVFVFWCGHAASSDQVCREYELAMHLSKVVVPVLLDDVPLPPGLSGRQGVDLRALETHAPNVLHLAPPRAVHVNQHFVINAFAPMFGIAPEVMESNLSSHGADNR